MNAGVEVTTSTAHSGEDVPSALTAPERLGRIARDHGCSPEEVLTRALDLYELERNEEFRSLLKQASEALSGMVEDLRDIRITMQLSEADILRMRQEAAASLSDATQAA